MLIVGEHERVPFLRLVGHVVGLPLPCEYKPSSAPSLSFFASAVLFAICRSYSPQAPRSSSSDSSSSVCVDSLRVGARLSIEAARSRIMATKPDMCEMRAFTGLESCERRVPFFTREEALIYSSHGLVDRGARRSGLALLLVAVSSAQLALLPWARPAHGLQWPRP